MAPGNGTDLPVEDWITRYLPRLRAFVRARIGPELRVVESSSDLVQSVCKELLTAREAFEFRGETEFRSWLFTAALNKIREHYRYHHGQKRDLRRVAHPTESQEALLHEGYATVCTPSQVMATAEQVRILEESLDRLEPDHKEVIGYSRIAGLPTREIAEQMGRSEGAVRQLLGRALIQLGTELRRQGLRPEGETL